MEGGLKWNEKSKSFTLNLSYSNSTFLRSAVHAEKKTLQMNNGNGAFPIDHIFTELEARTSSFSFVTPILPQDVAERVCPLISFELHVWKLFIRLSSLRMC